MAFETLNGIVLRYTDYRDNDRILSVLTRERGLVSITARACRKRNSPLAAIAEQFCYVEFVVYERSGIMYTSNAAVLESFYAIREDYDKLVSAVQVAHMTGMIAYQCPQNAELFSLCYHALSFIAYGEHPPVNVELCFAAKFLHLSGYMPTLTNCVACGRDLRKLSSMFFSKAQGGALCCYCGAGARPTRAIILEAIRRMALIPYEEIGKVILPGDIIDEVSDILYDYAEYVFEQTVRLRGR